MESNYFIYNNIKSSEMGLHIIRIDGGDFIDTPFFGGQELQEEITNNYNESYLYGTKMNPIEFTVQLSLVYEEWTPQRRNEIARWLIQRVYKPFQTCDDLGKYYYVICTDFPDLKLIRTMGYAEVTFRTNAPYAWTSEITETYDLSDNPINQIIKIENHGNVFDYYEPKTEIQVVKGDTFSLRNLSDGGREFSFSKLALNEIISVDNKNKFIKSSNPLIYRYKDFNKKWLRLIQGVNYIEVTGQIKLRIKVQYPIIQ